MADATIIAASLNDDELKASIDKLVNNVSTATALIRKDFDDTVQHIQKSFKTIGDIKIGGGGSADVDSSKRTSSLSKETQVVTNLATSYDNMAKAQQVAIRSANPSGVRNADTLQTMNIQLDLLRERLREARNQYSSFVALAAHAATTGDKGLYQFATSNVHKYEDEVRSLIPQIRTLQDGIKQMGDVIAPQGHTIQNYVNSLQKANPELAQLNDQFRRGKSLLQQSKTAYEENANAQKQNSDAANLSKKSIDDMNAHIRQSVQREQERRDAILQTGLAARETADQLIRSAHAQASTNGDAPISGVRELTSAIEQMRRAYYDMSSSEKQSPIGLALEADIKRAQNAISIITKYNRSLFNADQRGLGQITNASTLTSLKSSLKELTNQYSALTVAEINAGKGDAIIQHFQDVTRAAQILQNTLNRPINFEAVKGLQERNLDDIAYKMRQLQSYRSGLNVDTQREEITQVNAEYDRLKKKYDEVMGKNQSMINSNNALTRSWNYMKNRLAFYFTVGASTAFVKNLIDIRSQYELNERALGILINSAERGTQIFNELSQMALVSPYTLIELSAAAKQLVAYDIAARDVVDTTRRLADMASAVGVPMERLTYALGQIKAYGYLNSRDNRMFANAGIPLVKQLSDYYTELEGKLVSTADVYDRIKKKAVGYNDVMQVIFKMTDEGGRFFDFQAKMADTLKVRLANLTLAWNNMLNDIGKETQGVLTMGINALRTMFLHWRDLDTIIKQVGIALGIRTLFKLLEYSVIRTGVALGVTNKQMALSAVFGTRFANVIRTVVASTKTLLTTPLTWWSLLAVAAASAAEAIWNADKATVEFNKSIREGAKDNYGNISNFLEQYKAVRDSLYKTETVNGKNVTTPINIEKGEAEKVWEAIREQIELTSRAGGEYVGRLLVIENISERVRQGFNVLDDLQSVNAALKDIDDKTIQVSNDWSKWWNLSLLPDGLIENIKDYQNEFDKLIDKYGSLSKAQEIANQPRGGRKQNEEIDAAQKSLNNYARGLRQFQKDLQKTTDSVIDFITLKGWQADETKINEVFSQITNKLISDNALNPQQAFSLQLQMENARSEASKQALQIRIADENEALKVARDENTKADIQARLDSLNTQLADFDKFNGTSRAHWNEFTKWMSEQHKSEVTAMFRDMDDEQIKSLQSQSAVFDPWVVKMTEKYAKDHKLSYDEAFNYLKNWIYDANKWTVFIKTIIGTEDGKSIYETLTEADTAIDTAYKKIQRLRTRQRELEEKGGAMSSDTKVTKEYAEVLDEISSAQKDYNDALLKGGHLKKEDATARKAQKQAESELQKAFKDELQLIDKVRSQYKKLTDAGVDNATALTMVTNQFNNAISQINSTLGKNGLPLFNIKTFAGTDDPNKILAMLDAQLKAAKASQNVKPSEIKDLEVKYSEIVVDARVYNTKKITDGLNNELGKLKDEYELAVELDANPELGNMFVDMFGIDSSDFPRTIDDYMNRVQADFDKAREKLNYAPSLDIFTASEDDWKKWGDSVRLSADALDKFKSKFVDAQGLAKKWATDIVKQTQDLEYELADVNGKIAIEQKKLDDLQIKHQKETNAAKKHLLELQIQYQQNAIDKLKESILEMLPTYQRVFGQVAEHSAWMTRRLMQDYKTMLENAQKRGKNNNGKYEIIDPISGEVVEITENKLGKEIKNADKELRNAQSTVKKITEAFTKGEGGIVDWVQGLDYIAEEARKAAEGIRTVAEIVSELTGESGEGTVEVLNDIATSIDGLATASSGVAQIMNGDIIGGSVNVIKGTWQAISSWFDNRNKKINRQIRDSERTVKRLQNAYEALEYSVEKSMGAAEIGARRATVENKKLQLAELERQLALEKSRKKKKQDQDKIIELEGEVANVRREIQDLTEEVVSTLLGSDVKSAAEEFVDAWVQAWRAGETTLDAMNEKMDEMMQNLIKKAITSKIVGTLLQPFYDEVDRMTSTGSEGDETLTVGELKQLAQQAGITAEEINRALGEFYGNLDSLGILSQTQEANKELSALQQGIQGITEDTASALEAYMNGVSQQVYYQSQVLTEIRDAVVMMDGDVQLGTQAQMLLQLQQSYQVQMSIQNILQGVLNPSGRAFSVELVS